MMVLTIVVGMSAYAFTMNLTMMFNVTMTGYPTGVAVMIEVMIFIMTVVRIEGLSGRISVTSSFEVVFMNTVGKNGLFWNLVFNEMVQVTAPKMTTVIKADISATAGNLATSLLFEAMMQSMDLLAVQRTVTV